MCTQSVFSVGSVHPLTLFPWRVVEAQHILATRKLVDSAEEQILLEQLIEKGKPPLRAAADPLSTGPLHYLFFTPFRYPPLPHGSRLGTRMERGIWYGSEEVQTALAETAYYRLLFIEGSEADLGTVETRHTVFRGSVKTRRGVDLTLGAYAEHREAIASPTSYATSQALGGAMREAGVELARVPSARDAPEGVNVAVFSPNAFTLRNPTDLNDWYCVTQSDRVEFTKVDRLKSERYNFPREFFLVEGSASGGLPAPAV